MQTFYGIKFTVIYDVMFWVTIYQISLVLIVEEKYAVEKQHA